MNNFTPSENDAIEIRKANFGDILNLTELYCNLLPDVKRFFHPFTFNKNKVALVFFVLWINRYTLPVVKKIIPKICGNLVVAYDTKLSIIAGFAFFHITGREGSKYVANAGPIIFENFQGKRIGQRMYNLLEELAISAGISKFQVTVMESNTPSIMFHKKLGYITTGYADDEIWAGKREKNLNLELKLDSSR